MEPTRVNSAERFFAILGCSVAAFGVFAVLLELSCFAFLSAYRRFHSDPLGPRKALPTMPLYVDGFHLDSRGNEIVAHAIAQTIRLETHDQPLITGSARDNRPGTDGETGR